MQRATLNVFVTWLRRKETEEADEMSACVHRVAMVGARIAASESFLRDHRKIISKKLNNIKMLPLKFDHTYSDAAYLSS